jgi:hypothetical protein
MRKDNYVGEGRGLVKCLILAATINKDTSNLFWKFASNHVSLFCTLMNYVQLNNVVCKIACVFKEQRFILGPERDENMIIYAEWEELSQFIASTKALVLLCSYITAGVL